MAERSVSGTLINNTPYLLTLQSYNVTNGESDQAPPQSIAPSGSGNWETENGEMLTGTAGNLTYTGTDAEKNTFFVSCSWDDPFIGDNSFDNQTNLIGGVVSNDGHGGDNTNVTYTLALAS